MQVSSCIPLHKEPFESTCILTRVICHVEAWMRVGFMVQWQSPEAHDQQNQRTCGGLHCIKIQSVHITHHIYKNRPTSATRITREKAWITALPSYQHLWDHVIWDFIPPELFGNETVTVALRHSTCSAWEEEGLKRCSGQRWNTATTLLQQVLYLCADCSWF